MDELTLQNQLIIVTVLIGITYLSSFKSGKPICNRYLINHFLHLTTIITLYIYFINVFDDKKIKRNITSLIISIVLLIVLSIIYQKTTNILLKYILIILIIGTLAFLSERYYKKYDKEEFKKVVIKLIGILLICIFIAIFFPGIMKPKIEYYLFFCLLILLLSRLVDYFFLNKKYDTIISTLVIIVFSGFMIYDTKRVLDFKKLCINKGVQPNYLTNIFNMFINILNMFNNLLNIEGS
tara:strand:+ start:502 stop:1215 length:714 start_codon:yes stop_codon:yes gene_type:complete